MAEVGAEVGVVDNGEGRVDLLAGAICRKLRRRTYLTQSARWDINSRIGKEKLLASIKRYRQSSY